MFLKWGQWKCYRQLIANLNWKANRSYKTKVYCCHLKTTPISKTSKQCKHCFLILYAGLSFTLQFSQQTCCDVSAERAAGCTKNATASSGAVSHLLQHTPVTHLCDTPDLVIEFTSSGSAELPIQSNQVSWNREISKTRRIVVFEDQDWIPLSQLVLMFICKTM